MKSNKREKDIQNFFLLETISAKILFFLTLLALIVSNSFLKDYYHHFFYSNLSRSIPNLLFFINDGLMTIFFVVVSLEVKYEIVKGSLNSFRKAVLPGIGAIGGMLLPAIIYLSLNYHDKFLLRGWAVPTATDIAFSLAILTFVGNKISFKLKAYLTTLAIFDDIAAIIIIAFFYTKHIETIFLGLSFVCVFILFILNNIKIVCFIPYVLTGSILWFFFIKVRYSSNASWCYYGFHDSIRE